MTEREFRFIKKLIEDTKVGKIKWIHNIHYEYKYKITATSNIYVRKLYEVFKTDAGNFLIGIDETSKDGTIANWCLTEPFNSNFIDNKDDVSIQNLYYTIKEYYEKYSIENKEKIINFVLLE